MPSADQLKALIKAFSQGDEAQFHSVAMPIAASEARNGHGSRKVVAADLTRKKKFCARPSHTWPRSGPVTRARASIQWPFTKIKLK
jgi:hypothetical protein